MLAKILAITKVETCFNSAWQQLKRMFGRASGVTALVMQIIRRNFKNFYESHMYVMTAHLFKYKRQSSCCKLHCRVHNIPRKPTRLFQKRGEFLNSGQKGLTGKIIFCNSLTQITISRSVKYLWGRDGFYITLHRMILIIEVPSCLVV